MSIPPHHGFNFKSSKERWGPLLIILANSRSIWKKKNHFHFEDERNPERFNDLLQDTQNKIVDLKIIHVIYL